MATPQGSTQQASSIKVAVVQFEHVNGNKEKNFEKVAEFVRDAAKQHVQLIVFPECCLSGYWFLRKLSRAQLLDLAEPVPSGPSTQHLLKIAKDHQMMVGAGLLERTEGDDATAKMYNTYVVAMPNGTVVRHRKIQAFESDHISAGDTYTLFDTQEGVKVAILICYDNNIVENVRMVALQGAQVLLSPHQTGGCNSASPFGMKTIDVSLWHNRHTNPEAIRAEINGPKGKGWIMRWLPSRAHDNGLFLLFSNGVGVDDDEVRTGNSMILDPYGRTVAEFNEPSDGMIIADLDLTLIPMSTGRRWLKVRKPQLYQLLATPIGIEQDTRVVRFTYEEKKKEEGK